MDFVTNRFICVVVDSVRCISAISQPVSGAAWHCGVVTHSLYCAYETCEITVFQVKFKYPKSREVFHEYLPLCMR